MARNAKKPNMQKPPAPVETVAPRRITKLSELQPRTIDVVIERPNGQESIAVPCRELTYKRFYEIGRLVPDPIPQKGEAPIDFAKDEKGELVKVYDVNWHAHRQAVAEAETRRTMWRLTEFVDLEFEATDIEDRINELENTLPNDVVQGLIIAMRSIVFGSEARVEERAASFHSNGHRNTNHLPTPSVEN